MSSLQHKFRVGQKVKVIRRATEQEEAGCSCSWVSPEMDEGIGKTGIVSGITRVGNIKIDFKDPFRHLNRWIYPLPCVTLSEDQLLFEFMYDKE